MIGPEGTDNCHKFVDILGLRTVFPLFMKTPKKMKKTGTSEKEHEGQCLRRHTVGQGEMSWMCLGLVCCFPFPTGALNRLLLFWPVNLHNPSSSDRFSNLLSWTFLVSLVKAGGHRQEPEKARLALCSLLHYQLYTLNVEPLPPLCLY